MTLLLDADCCVDILRSRPPEVRATFLSRVVREPVAISTITLMELAFGIGRSHPTRREKNRAALRLIRDAPVEIIPFDEEDAEATGLLNADLTTAGATIGAYDVQLAGQALRRGWTVVTANLRHFGRVPGLRLENWRPTPP
jgi:tRNA(fMet)-specific endonuclease VapC